MTAIRSHTAPWEVIEVNPGFHISAQENIFGQGRQDAFPGGRGTWVKVAVFLIATFVSLLFTDVIDARAQALSHGPVAGGVSATDAKVFTRTSGSATVTIQYSVDPGLASAQSSPSVATDSSSDYTSIIRLSSLLPETTYYLNVLVNGVGQLSAPYPTFKTFPVAGSVRNFKFVYLTDFARMFDQAPGTYPAFRNSALENPAFAFIGGDFDHTGPITLADKRTMFKLLYDPTKPGQADFVNKVLRGTAIVHQWDDHDAGWDNIDKTYSGWSLAYQVFREYMPMYDTPALPPAIWQPFSYAQVDFFVLDNRSQRNNEYEIDNANKSMLDGNHLGPQGELAWLENGLLSSTATWKIIFSSVVANQTTRFVDGWAGYQTEWNSLKGFIRKNNIKNVVILSADLHFGGIDNGGASGLPEMLVGNVNIVQAKGATCRAGNVGTWSVGTYYNDNGSCRQYGVVTVTTNPDQLLLQIKDENANVKISYTLSAQ
jgi:alkaline phosphatase D